MREPKPITRIEVTEGNRKLRIVLIVALLVIGAVALTSGFMSLLGRDAGWQIVEVSNTEADYSREILLQYNFSGTGAQATALHKRISAVYSEAMVKAYQVFRSETAEGNLADVNAHVNETVTVDALLYSALEKLQSTRYHYMGPVYAYYDSVIYSTSDPYLADVDPRLNQEARAYVSQLAAFAADEMAVHLELLDNFQVKLHVSDAYLDFARENEITNFVDLHYMANAFTIDYLAQILMENGYTSGFLVSIDGCTRNLDSSQAYQMNLVDMTGDTVYPVGVMQYQGPASMILLKSFPVSGADTFYRQSGDHILFPYADPADGMYKASVASLLGYSYEEGCADVLLKMIPSFAAEDFQVPQGIYSVWCQDRTVYYNDSAITITQLLDKDGIRYTAQMQ